MKILEPFLPMFDLSSKEHEFLVNTPRSSAKSTHIAQLAAHLVGHVCRSKPRDIVFFEQMQTALLRPL